MGPSVVAVAVSGGLDSMALLHASCAQAQPLGLEVVALHVHHGLHDQADTWLDHVATHCQRWRQDKAWPVRLCALRLSGGPEPGQSVEAWARAGRYRALAHMALQAQASLILLAHHRSDQAETFLIQALRGAGPAGLAAMAMSTQDQEMTWARPWLNRSRRDIEAYAQAHGLQWVEDPSNQDTRFARNRWRHELMPQLGQVFPQAEVALAHAARRAAEADACLQDLAALDARVCLAEAIEGQHKELVLAPALALSDARLKNVLRWWAASLPCKHFPDSLLERLCQELRSSQRGGRRWPTPVGWVEQRRGRLRWAA